MFFAPLLNNSGALKAPNPSSDFGLERFMRETLGALASGFHDLEEDERSWTLHLDVPGVPREQLRVQISGNRLEVETDRQARRQLRAVYQLPSGIDADRTEAHLQDGVLTVKVAKAESALARRIEIQ